MIRAAIARHKAAWDAFQVAPDDMAEDAEIAEDDALWELLRTSVADSADLDALADHLRWFVTEEVQRAGIVWSYDTAAAMLAVVTIRPVEPSGSADLAFRRRRLGWSQDELAKRAGTSQQNVDRLERGEVKTSKVWPALAAALLNGEASARSAVPTPIEGRRCPIIGTVSA